MADSKGKRQITEIVKSRQKRKCHSSHLWLRDVLQRRFHNRTSDRRERTRNKRNQPQDDSRVTMGVVIDQSPHWKTAHNSGSAREESRVSRTVFGVDVRGSDSPEAGAGKVSNSKN